MKSDFSDDQAGGVRRVRGGHVAEGRRAPLVGEHPAVLRREVEERRRDAVGRGELRGRVRVGPVAEHEHGRAIAGRRVVGRHVDDVHVVVDDVREVFQRDPGLARGRLRHRQRARRGPPERRRQGTRHGRAAAPRRVGGASGARQAARAGGAARVPGTARVGARAGRREQRRQRDRTWPEGATDEGHGIPTTIVAARRQRLTSIGVCCRPQGFLLGSAHRSNALPAPGCNKIVTTPRTPGRIQPAHSLLDSPGS